MESPPFSPETISADHEAELTDEDILDAIQHISGYLDIRTEDSPII